ncbi:diguanylate cyclase domain-containing protein [Oscillatoria salina]|uniref:diguanylate cyclase domain-containing protein n=1 Tax=Oscillatoria salina TaxID=331517 RepID=UPI0013B87C8E|nr:response regulator [Oscillatoria salina]MBZ8180187.1 diguanylate cyclase [Oscillatoria salina IIICB1]NET90261.1 diguanylate cyclase [Kamptonema sp. SIO1D9]
MLTSNQSLKILLVEDEAADADLIGELLGDVYHTRFELKAVARLEQAIEFLQLEQFEVILLDLSLPDSKGLDTLIKVKEQVKTIPVVVLTALNDENLAIEAVRAGAQDYLVKGKFSEDLLIRSLRYAIERQRAEEANRQQAQRERLLSKIVDRIRQSLQLEEILQTTVAEVQQFLKTDRVLIYRCYDGCAELAARSPESGKILVEAMSANSCCGNTEALLNNLVLPWVCQQDSQWIQVLEDVNSQMSAEDLQTINCRQVKAVLTVPIWQTGEWKEQVNSIWEKEDNCGGEAKVIRENKPQLWGILTAHHCRSAREWQEWEIKFLRQLAAQVAIAIQQSELCRQLKLANQKLHQLATSDPLTGVANRRKFQQVLQQSWRLALKEQKLLSIIICDIDFFKNYNDYYGHLAGDACLQQVCQAIAKASKNTASVLARYGGEEFIALLLDYDLKTAIAIAEQMRQQVESLKLPNFQSSPNQYVTISCGVASTIPSVKLSVSSLIKSADVALYQAKALGKNCIYSTFYPPEVDYNSLRPILQINS